MKKIKVYLQYPIKVSDSSYYKYLLTNPPNNVDYINFEKKDLGVIQSKKKILLFNFLKDNVRRIVRALKIQVPNAHLTHSKKRYDIIHCAHCLSLNKKPWVADFEWDGQFLVNGSSLIKRSKALQKILNSEYCKKIICWTDITQKRILKIYPELESKTELVYPGIPAQKFKKVKHKGIKLLFTSRRFYCKGGLHALEVIDKLIKKYKNVEAIFNSLTPEHIRKKYSKNKKIKFIEVIPQETLFKKIYPQIDLLIYPAYIDSFGFALTEALSFGVPIVTVDGYSRKEVVEDGKTGFVIKRPSRKIEYETINEKGENLIKKMVEKASVLIENKKLREKMSKNAIECIKNGRFSIKKRNKIFKRIYEEALKQS